MKYEEAGLACTKNFCPKYQDIPHECPKCPIAKECWAGYHIEASRMTANDFRIWLDSHNVTMVSAVEAALENSPTR